MKRSLFIAIILTCSVSSTAQHKDKVVKPAKVVTSPNRSDALLTNRYSYYNRERGGYIIYENGHESFVPSLPIIPENTTYSRTFVPLSKRLDLDLYPQLHFPNNDLALPDRKTK